MHAIAACDLVKTYPKGVRALDGLSFEAESGTIFALLGPNGAGKSTAVKILTTLARADSGGATVAGIDVLANPDGVRRAIGVVAQGSGVDIQATGRENLRLQGQIYGMHGATLARRIDELLELMRLSDAGDRIARGYSGGMVRRLDIAMALIHEPEVLFLDEPTTGLDPEVRADMWELISGLTAEHGKTVLLTTHYLEEADQLASSLAIVDGGRIVAEGTPELLKRELRGDAIEVELGAGGTGSNALNGNVDAVLAAVPGIHDLGVDGRMLRARADDGGRSVPALLGALESRGLRVASVRVARPSLDDVYLRYTGRRYQEADR